jgi:threonyl-tRNA synthetase
MKPMVSSIHDTARHTHTHTLPPLLPPLPVVHMMSPFSEITIVEDTIYSISFTWLTKQHTSNARPRLRPRSSSMPILTCSLVAALLWLPELPGSLVSQHDCIVCAVSCDQDRRWTCLMLLLWFGLFSLMFDNHLRSYRELPVRFADFGALHRNEISGALTGLTRVRRFQQDDAHIFCRQDQIEVEVAGVLDFLRRVYGIFGFEFSLQLSTRPKKFLGEIAVWDEAEKALGACLDKFCNEMKMPWTLNAEDGAFYGPKIDIQLTDALKRKHQCATIQLDFQLPIKFELQYKGSGDQFERPVIIHRAILGSVERFMSVLIEHTGGKWPFWLSPRQISIVPVAEAYFPYADAVRKTLHDAGYYVDVDTSNKQLAKKVREAALAQYNYILVVGEKEQKEQSVNVRLRQDPEHPYEKKLDALLEELKGVTDKFE